MPETGFSQTVELRLEPRRTITVSFTADAQFQPGEDLTITPFSRFFASGDTLLISALQQPYQWAELVRGRNQYVIRGRKGQGPGEFERISYVAGGGDGIRVVFHDLRLSRLNATAEYQGGLLFPAVPVAVTAGRPGIFRIVAMSSGGEYALHTLDSDGTTSVIPLPAPETESAWLPTLVAFDSAGIVLMNARSYDLARYDTSGKLVSHWTRSPEWFRAGKDAAGFPYTAFTALHAQGSLLFVLAAVRTTDAPFDLRDLTAMNEHNDYILEVIDAGKGVILGSQRFADAPFTGTLGREGVYRLVEDPITGVIGVQFLTVVTATD